ncbi:hypothetical protein SGLAM104S_09161 [Streptomyces glaucescens]
MVQAGRHTDAQPGGDQASWVWCSSARWAIRGSMPWRAACTAATRDRTRPRARDPLVVVKSSRSISSRSASGCPSAGDLHGIVEDLDALASPKDGQRLVVPVQDDRQVGVAGVHPVLLFQSPRSHAQRRMVGAQRGERLGEQPPHRGGERRQPQFACPRWASRSDGGFDLRDARRVLGELLLGRVVSPSSPPGRSWPAVLAILLQLGHSAARPEVVMCSPSAAPLTEPPAGAEGVEGRAGGPGSTCKQCYERTLC